MPAALRRRWRRLFESLARPRAHETLPVRFDRKRIYILPSRFGAFFLALLLAMGVGALNYNNNPALLLCLLLAGAAIASLLAAQLQLGGLTIHAIGAEPVAAGNPLQLRVHVRAAPGRRRHALRVAIEGSHARLRLSNDAGEAVLSLSGLQRGWMDVPRLVFSTTHPLGLARAWAYARPDTTLLVYPAPEAYGPPIPQGIGENTRSRVHPSGDDVHQLRGWRQGDARRAIAWKPSARRDVLMVREYEHAVAADLVIDWPQTRELDYEDRIRRLARWVDEAEREARRYRLLLPGQPAIGPGQGPQHRHACLRALALLPFAPATGDGHGHG